MNDERHNNRNNTNHSVCFADLFNNSVSVLIIFIIYWFFVLFVKENEK